MYGSAGATGMHEGAPGAGRVRLTCRVGACQRRFSAGRPDGESGAGAAGDFCPASGEHTWMTPRAVGMTVAEIAAPCRYGMVA